MQVDTANANAMASAQDLDRAQFSPLKKNDSG